MPIYEYYCQKCDPEGKYPEEVLQTPSIVILPICKKCGTVKEKKISAGSFILKGSGFYKNDYGPKPKKEDK